jgi:hypothetical protein
MKIRNEKDKELTTHHVKNVWALTGTVQYAATVKARTATAWDRSLLGGYMTRQSNRERFLESEGSISFESMETNALTK